MSYCLDKLQKAKSLPLGHYGLAEAYELVEIEYGACREQERKLLKQYKFKNRYFELQEAANLCGAICSAIGHKQIKRVVIRSKEIHPCAGAEYNSSKKEIHFPHSTIHLSSLLHELAHHFDPHAGHGTRFMEMQELVYEIANSILNKKEDDL